MKKTKFYFLACSLFAGTLVGGVQAQELTKVYSGESLPTSQGWQELKLDGTVNPTAGSVSQQTNDGVLKLQSPSEANKFSQLGWYKTNVNLDLSKGYTIEIKAKINNAAKYGAFNIQGFDIQGKAFRLGIYKEFLAESTNPLAATNVLKNGLNNADDFHTYRLAVRPDGTVTVYRDLETIGTFPLSAFYYDNIIENGGFEDGDDDPSAFPDFKHDNGFMVKGSTDYDPEEVHTGDWSLIMGNDGHVTKLPNKNDEEAWDPSYHGYGEKARTRELPVKTGTDYSISIARKRLTENHAWRDMGAFYDTQDGTQNGTYDERDQNAMWAGANEDFWQVHNQKITTPEDVKSLRFEFPSWNRDNAFDFIDTAFDDFYFAENLGLPVAAIEKKEIEFGILPETYVNLIANGGFEDHELNNDGSDYFWATSDPDEVNSNEPVDYNEVWNGDVRLQTFNKDDDQMGGQWAHSGTTSLRFSSLGDRESGFNFIKELEAGKTYRFNFWYRNPHWNDHFNLRVAIGDNIIWGHRLGREGWNNRWENVDLTFTTTDQDNELKLYSDYEHRGDWFNIYFDDLVLYEVTEPDPLAGKTNLFPNGDFEDETKDIDGTPYAWVLASETDQRPDDRPDDNNYPVKWNDLWGTDLRLQDERKGEDGGEWDDTGIQWAHSGTKSLRFTYLGDTERINMDFRKALEPNKTYTFVFWFKTANYGDRGNFKVAVGDVVVWNADTGNEAINWSRQTVTFSTTSDNYELRMFTELNGWFNFYLDDLFLYEETTYRNIDSYLFFGKPTSTQATDVEIKYVAVCNTGAYSPSEASVGIEDIDVNNRNLSVSSSNGELTIKVLNPASVDVYDVAGTLVSQINVYSQESIALPKGVYIVKATSNGVTETIKAVN